MSLLEKFKPHNDHNRPFISPLCEGYVWVMSGSGSWLAWAEGWSVQSVSDQVQGGRVRKWIATLSPQFSPSWEHYLRGNPCLHPPPLSFPRALANYLLLVEHHLLKDICKNVSRILQTTVFSALLIVESKIHVAEIESVEPLVCTYVHAVWISSTMD